MSGTDHIRNSDRLAEFARMAAVVDSVMASKATATIAEVVAVHGGGTGPVGTVDVQFLVNQVDGKGVSVPHGKAYGLPYLRYQGGSSAVIIDPQPGDIGTVVFASRDISSVVANRGQANPGSMRQMDMSDGMFMPGILNAAPTQYLQFTGDAANLVALSTINLNAPQVSVPGNLIVGDGVTGTFIDQSGATMTFVCGILVNGTNLA